MRLKISYPLPTVIISFLLNGSSGREVTCSAINRGFYLLKEPNECELWPGVPIKVASDDRSVSFAVAVF